MQNKKKYALKIFNFLNLGRNSGGHNFSDSEIHIPTVITSQSVNAVTSHNSMNSPVMSAGRVDFDCISRLVEIDAILEEDRDESMDACHGRNYGMASTTRSNEEIDLDLLVTLKNPTISKQKQIEIGLETLTGTALELRSGSKMTPSEIKPFFGPKF